MDKTIVTQSIRENLSLKGYIDLINEYNELERAMYILNNKRNEKGCKFQRVNEALKVFKENSISIPSELILLHQNVKIGFQNIVDNHESYYWLMEDIAAIVGIKNLRNVVCTIANKNNKSYHEISKLVGMSDNSLSLLVNEGHIELKIFKKFMFYYKINKIVSSWSRYTINEEAI